MDYSDYCSCDLSVMTKDEVTMDTFNSSFNTLNLPTDLLDTRSKFQAMVRKDDDNETHLNNSSPLAGTMINKRMTMQREETMDTLNTSFNTLNLPTDLLDTRSKFQAMVRKDDDDKTHLNNSSPLAGTMINKRMTMQREETMDTLNTSFNTLNLPTDLLDTRSKFQAMVRKDDDKKAHLNIVTASSFQSHLDEASMKHIERQIDSRFKDLESRLLTRIESLNELLLNLVKENNHRFNAMNQNILSMEKSDIVRQNTIDSTIKEKRKALYTPTNLVPGFETSKLTWRYQSHLGNYLTANTYYSVSVDRIGAFQEWTAIPIDSSHVILRNEHGSFLRASQDGSIKSQHEPLSSENWTVKNYSDGTLSLVSEYGSYLSDNPDIGICVTKQLGWHRWKLKP
jgi:hypothetical protein